jgi:hypothetical protein
MTPAAVSLSTLPENNAIVNFLFAILFFSYILNLYCYLINNAKVYAGKSLAKFFDVRLDNKKCDLYHILK